MATPALGVGVGVGRPDGGCDDPGSVGLEHCIEGPAELGVPVVDEEPGLVPAFGQVGGDVPALLG